MENYSVGVAIFDFLPALALASGLIPLARSIAARHHALAPIAWFAALLIPLGGFCKAGWKLNMALVQQDIAWLENMLFICLAPGFVVMAFCLFHARKAWQLGQSPTGARHSMTRLLLWLSVPALGAVVAAYLLPDSRLWFFWLLGVTTIANAALLVHAIIAARLGSLHWAVSACFVGNFAATLALSGLSRLPGGEASAWIQESINLSAQTMLAIGCIQLARRMRQDL